MKDCYQWIRKDKIDFLMILFLMSLSKFSIKNNFVVILTAKTGEAFSFVSYNILR